MSGPRLLVEFFSDGLCLLFGFLTHPVTVGACMLFVSTIGLTMFCAFLCDKFPSHFFVWDTVSTVVFLFGIVLMVAFVLWSANSASALAPASVGGVAS